jgi:hypothetical protein
MKRTIVVGLIAALSLLTLPGVALAGVGPSPFNAPGLMQDLWTAPGQLVGFAPQPEPPGSPMWTPIAQTKGEPPGTTLNVWTSPGQLVGFAPQPEPPGSPWWTPIAQANQIYN